MQAAQMNMAAEGHLSKTYCVCFFLIMTKVHRKLTAQIILTRASKQQQKNNFVSRNVTYKFYTLHFSKLGYSLEDKIHVALPTDESIRLCQLNNLVIQLHHSSHAPHFYSLQR